MRMVRGLNVILLHSKAATDAEIKSAAVDLVNLGVAKVTSARKHWERAGAGSGGFAGWPQAVLRTGYGTTRPEFDALVVPQRRVGKATADIVNLALKVKRPIFVLDEALANTRALTPVTGIRTIDGRDFQTGWELQ